MKIDKLYIVLEIGVSVIDWDKNIPIPKIGEQISIEDHPLKIVTMIRYSVVENMMEIKIITSNN